MIKLEQITHIRNKISPTIPIIVEGKRDKTALEKLGFKNIIPISGRSNEKVLQLIKNKKQRRVAILTDFDKEGRKKCAELTRLLQKNSIKIDSFVRTTFNRTFKIHKIEELSSFTKLIEDDYYGKNSSIYEKMLNRKTFLKKQKKKRT